MNKAYWTKWLKAAGIRALRTVAQTAVATIGTSVAMGDVSWALVCSASLLAGILSMLTSVAGLPELPEPEPEGVDVPEDMDVPEPTDEVDNG